MKYNLQFFAEETAGAENSGTAEPAIQSETVNSDANTTEATAETSPEGAQTSPQPEEESVDRNAIFAEARRTFERKQNAINAKYAERFKGLVNPETNKPITTPDEYLEALDAQERMRAKEELQSKGVSLDTIENLINNSPRLRQAEQMLAEFRQQKVEQSIMADISELNKLDPTITSLETVPREVIEFGTQNNMTLVNAYKIMNFGKVNAQQTQAIQQRTINQIAGKAHLAPVGGVAQNVVGVDIPEKNLASWRSMYPELSDAELRKKYNAALNGKR